jgi:hypothetical protein
MFLKNLSAIFILALMTPKYLTPNRVTAVKGLIRHADLYFIKKMTNKKHWTSMSVILMLLYGL